MRSIWLVSTMIFFVLSSLTLQAASVVRQVQFGWEPVDEAWGYDLELKPSVGKEKPKTFRVRKADWSGRLAVGNYEMRVRTLDDRKVPGEWSEVSVIQVPLEKVKFVQSLDGRRIQSRNPDDENLKISWARVPAGESYRVKIKGKGGFEKEETTSRTDMNIKLPVAQEYEISIVALGEHGLQSEAESKQNFTLLGPQLQKPQVASPENEFVRELKWSMDDRREYDEVVLLRRNEKTKKYEPFQKIEHRETGPFVFSPEWPGGQYRVRVRSHGNLRKSSVASVTDFKVRNGDRSPAAEFTAEVRKSIDRISGWYGIASYFISMVNYQASSLDQSVGSRVAFSALGGTGRLGVGYLMDEKPWGFLATLDYSGMINQEKKNVTYASSEVSGIYRTRFGDRDEVRLLVGGAYRELPVAVVDVSNQRVSEYKNSSVVAGHGGAEYWYSISPKLGFQLNTHLYMNLFPLSSVNGQKSKMSFSSQFGILGSYRLGKKMTGLVGYARRDDRYEYESSGASGGSNSATLSGNYLNLFLEYGF